MPASSSNSPPSGRHPFPIDVDLYCQNCGYNVRGLVEGTRCPECSTSIRFKLLRSKATWTKCRIALAAACPVVVFSLLISNAVLLEQTEWTGQMPHEVAESFMRIWQCVGVGALLLGAILLTQKRIPLLLWLAVGFVLLASAAGWFLNRVLWVLILMSI
ncbi:MAG: hypothetical protein IT430_16610 [Phycisphaerales bacterium]|nr:hypothetical protein [Phycisphaerales bacterium]